MSPSYSTKNRVRYRFYVSSALLKGRKKSAGSKARVSSVEIETAVTKALRTHLPDCSLPDPSLVKLSENNLQIRLKRPQTSSNITPTDVEEFNVSWAYPQSGPLSRIENADTGEEPEPKLALVHAIARAHVGYVFLLMASTILLMRCRPLSN